MLFITQLLNLLTVEQIELFINLFDDLSFEIDEMGYKGMEGELINDMLFNHLGFTFEDGRQLEKVAQYILKNQGQLKNKVRAMAMIVGKEVA